MKAKIDELVIKSASCIYGLGLAAEDYAPDKFRYLRISDIDDYGNLINGEKKYVYCEDAEHYKLRQNDLVVARTGNSTGRAYMYSDTDGEMVYAGFLIKYVFDETKINPRYMKYYCQSQPYKEQIKVFSGSTRGNMNAQDFLGITVYYPNRYIQNGLVALFDKIDDKIKVNNKINTELEAMAKTVYDYWFLQFEFPNENGKPYKSSGGKMIWNDELKREIPEGWEVSELGQLFTTERGLSYSTPNIETGKGVPMINLANFRPGGGAYKTEGLKHYLGEYPQNKVLKPYDLVMCNTQQTSVNFATDIIGRAMLVPDIFDSEIVSSHHVNVIRTKTEELKYYLLYLFNTDFFHKYISGYTNGTNILGLSFDGVEKYKSEIPNNIILIKFANLVKQIEMKKSEILKENQELSLLRDFLLPMLMNGQVGLKND